MKKLHAGAAVGVLLSIGFGPVAQADDAMEAQVKRHLLSATTAMGDEAYELTTTYVARMNDGRVDSLTVSLEANRNYLLVGACDADCRGIDFWLFDENDNLIDGDTANEAPPVVSIKPVRSANFILRVAIQECDNNPCSFGIALATR